MKFLKISSEEKKLQLAYLASLWLGLTIVFMLVFLSNYESEPLEDKDAIAEKVAAKNKLVAELKGNLKHLDSLKVMLAGFNPEVKQVHLESSINYELKALEKLWQSDQELGSHNTYMQAATFYSMLYYDKKAVVNTVNNKAFLKKNLEECEVGFQQNRNNLSLQEVLNNMNK
ncbi:type VI secretion system TssO [Cytophagaceae bacterium ABcell3]|nr:type VI secretion system TssO [Cytophagaceae bacterium ABcell3]